MGAMTTSKRRNGTGVYPAVFASALTGGIKDVSRSGLRPYQITTSYRDSKKGGFTLGEEVNQIFLDSDQATRWPFDTGHEFYTQKMSGLILDRKGFSCRGYNNSYYSGPLLAVDPFFLWEGLSADNMINYYQLPRPAIKVSRGTKFLAETVPVTAQANLTQLIVETVLRLPTIPFNGLDSNLHNGVRTLLKNSGGEYLNAVFGWEPLVRDVLKVCRAIVMIDDNLKQYVRDSGKVVRRKRRDPRVEYDVTQGVEDNSLIGAPFNNHSGADPNRESDLFAGPTGVIGNQPNGYRASRGKLTIVDHVLEEYWFSGAWMYFLDVENNAFNAIRRAAKEARYLLGIELSLHLLYELAPWSWLLDWFVNINDLIKVNQALGPDGSVLRYGYLMHHTVVERSWTHTGVVFGNGTATGPIVTKARQETKQRVRATPYGFDIDWPDFSPRRLAILGSLIATHGAGSARL